MNFPLSNVTMKEAFSGVHKSCAIQLPRLTIEQKEKPGPKDDPVGCCHFQHGYFSSQALRELNSSQTSTERGLQRWEQAVDSVEIRGW